MYYSIGPSLLHLLRMTGWFKNAERTSAKTHNHVQRPPVGRTLWWGPDHPVARTLSTRNGKAKENISRYVNDVIFVATASLRPATLELVTMPTFLITVATLLYFFPAIDIIRYKRFPRWFRLFQLWSLQFSCRHVSNSTKLILTIMQTSNRSIISISNSSFHM